MMALAAGKMNLAPFGHAVQTHAISVAPIVKKARMR
jgi:hypothetical protein